MVFAFLSKVLEISSIYIPSIIEFFTNFILPLFPIPDLRFPIPELNV